MSDYIPIACALHDRYEIAIMHRKKLKISWPGEGGEQHTAKVMPKDIIVRDKQEFLLAVLRDGDELCIRLDMLTLLKD